MATKKRVMGRGTPRTRKAQSYKARLKQTHSDSRAKITGRIDVPGGRSRPAGTHTRRRMANQGAPRQSTRVLHALRQGLKRAVEKGDIPKGGKKHNILKAKIKRISAGNRRENFPQNPGFWDWQRRK